MHAGHIIDLCILTDSNTGTLIYIVINLCPVPDSNITAAFATITIRNTCPITNSDTVISCRTSFTDSNGIRTFSAIIIIVSTTSSGINCEEVNLISIYSCCQVIDHGIYCIKLCHVNSISCLSTGCNARNLTS